MKRWKIVLLIVGIALEIVSICGFIYMTTVIPELDFKAIAFYSAPVVGMLYGIFVLRIAVKIKTH